MQSNHMLLDCLATRYTLELNTVSCLSSTVCIDPNYKMPLNIANPMATAAWQNHNLYHTHVSHTVFGYEPTCISCFSNIHTTYFPHCLVIVELTIFSRFHGFLASIINCYVWAYVWTLYLLLYHWPPPWSDYVWLQVCWQVGVEFAC